MARIVLSSSCYIFTLDIGFSTRKQFRGTFHLNYLPNSVDGFSKYDFTIRKKFINRNLVIFTESHGRMRVSRIFYSFSQIIVGETSFNGIK